MGPERDTYDAPAHGWTCFHCGETFLSERSARDHFGALPDATPVCAMGGLRGLVRALRKSESRNRRLRAELFTVEGQVPGLGTWAAFDGAESLQDARFNFESVEGRALAAEAVLKEIAQRWPALIEAARRRV